MADLEFRSDINWYINIKWDKWYHSKLNGWNRACRRNDVIMSAMFMAAKGKAPKYYKLAKTIGLPDWVVGSPSEGCAYYKMKSRPDIESGDTYMCFFVLNGVIRSGGTNKRLKFSRNNAFRKICLTSQRRGDPSCAWAPFPSVIPGRFATSLASLCR
jgi:hypothetical protein